MYLVLVLALLLSGAAEYAVVQSTHVTNTMSEAQSRGSADSIGVLATASNTYLQLNPGANGNVPASGLPVPSWYQVSPNASGVVYSGGLSYVYLTPANGPAATRAVAVLAGRGFVSGIASSGTLRAPGGAVVTAAPASIPDGSVVIVL